MGGKREREKVGKSGEKIHGLVAAIGPLYDAHLLGYCDRQAPFLTLFVVGSSINCKDHIDHEFTFILHGFHGGTLGW